MSSSAPRCWPACQHDLRTILTRFRLELAFLGEGTKVQALKEDVEEMQRMLEAYMAFVRGDGGERAEADGYRAAAALGARREDGGAQPIAGRRSKRARTCGQGEAQCVPPADRQSDRQCGALSARRSRSRRAPKAAA